MAVDPYDLKAYAAMAADTVRVDAYRRALADVITPGCTVVDLGAGTGLLGFMACALGAGHVIFIEPAAEAEFITRVARSNGVQHRVTVFRNVSSRVELREPADVLVSDLRATLPFSTGHVDAIVDARQRLLRPAGRLIPLRDTIVADLVSAAPVFDRLVGVWDTCVPGWDQSAFRDLAARTSARVRLSAQQVSGDPQILGHLDYATIVSPHMNGEAVWRIRRPITGYGAALWFETNLTERAGFSAGPGGATAYGQLYLPWPEALPLSTDDVVSIRVLIAVVQGPYLFHWRTRVTRRGVELATFDSGRTQ